MEKKHDGERERRRGEVKVERDVTGRLDGERAEERKSSFGVAFGGRGYFRGAWVRGDPWTPSPSMANI